MMSVIVSYSNAEWMAYGGFLNPCYVGQKGGVKATKDVFVVSSILTHFRVFG